MKKEQKSAAKREPLTKEALFKRNPIPFGDVRKYYLAGKVGTVVLLALCFHISVAAIALRTDTCVQIPNGIIAVLLLCAILNIIGHYSRTIAGYALSVVVCLILVLVMQLYNGGLMLQSDLPEYGEVFRDGAKSTDFWILLAKVLAVVHLLLSVVFINSTLTVKEEPELKGMNIQIKKFQDWLDKNNNSLPPGRRASDYWFVVAQLLCAMVFWAADPNMTKYDYYSLGALIAGCVFVAFKRTFTGSFLLAVSALIRCTEYQYRLGIRFPVIAAYLGFWIALLYFAMESLHNTRKTTLKKASKWVVIVGKVFPWMAVVIMVSCIPVHEFLSVFSGSLMPFQKDNLPLIFFLPILILLAMKSGHWYAYCYAGICFVWIWFSLNRATPYKNMGLFYFDSIDEHGSIGSRTTMRMMALVEGISIATIVAAIFCICFAVIVFITGGYYLGKKEKVSA